MLHPIMSHSGIMAQEFLGQIQVSIFINHLCSQSFPHTHCTTFHIIQIGIKVTAAQCTRELNSGIHCVQ